MSEGLSPLSQFEIKPLIPIHVGGWDLSFTNASLAMVLAVIATFAVMYLFTAKRALVPGRLQSMAELFYEFIEKLMNDIIGPSGKQFFPFILALFLFIFFGNAMGMIPFNFTFTSHIIVTAAMALFVFAMITIVGLVKHGTHFFSLFFPKNIPWALAPLIIPVEIISYFARPLTLAFRLAANMMAGHAVLYVFGSFSVMAGMILGFVPLIFVIMLVGFEFVVAVLQAFIFTLLTCVYLNDAVNLH